MTRRTRRRALYGVCGVALGLVSAACTPSPSQSPSQSPPETPAPSSAPTPVTADVGAAAVKAAAAYLSDNGYTITKTSGYYLYFTGGGDKFTSKMTCEGGQTTHVGWQGICAAPNEKAFGMVVAARVTAGPKIATVAMEEDVAASCGDETMPTWVITALKTAKGQYCFLNEGDG